MGNKTGKLVLGAGIQQAGAEVLILITAIIFISGFCIETPNKAIGIRFKSLDDAGVKNLHIDNVVFNGTFYGGQRQVKVFRRILITQLIM